MNTATETLTVLGWREWLSLPDLNIPSIAAKVDTGARSSCLHTFGIEAFHNEGEPWIKFHVHPIQDDNDTVITRECRVHDQREVSDSGGHKELRYVIQTTLTLNNDSWPIEVTLTNRDTMRFRMLLGRTAMNGRCVVNPQASWLLGDISDDTLIQTWRGTAK